MSEQHNSTTTVEERQKLFGLWAAGVFAVIGLAFFSYATYTLFFIQQGQAAIEDTVLLPITVLMFVVSAISFFLIRGNRFTLGFWLLVLANLMIPSILGVLVLRNIYPVVITYLITLTTILVFLVFPRASRWQVLTASAVTILIIIGIELWNPVFRGATANLSNFTVGMIVLASLGFLAFFIRQAWRGSLRTKLLVSTLVITGLTIAVISIFAVYNSSQSQTFMIDQLQNAVRLQSRQQIKDTVFAATLDAEETLSEMVEEVEKLAEYHAALYAQSSILEQGAYWDANTRLTKLPGGQYDNPDSDIASVFIPSIVTLDEAIVANINTGIYLDFTVPTILRTNQNIVAVYFIGTDGTTIYYPNINLAEVVPPDFDPRLRPFYSIATPEKNPEHKVVWTDPYQDVAGNGLLVTASAPVYDQAGKFRGVVAVDVQLIDISTNVAEIKVGESGFAFLIDSSGRLLGMPDAGYRFFNLTLEIVPVDETPKQTILGVGSIDLQEIFRKMTSGETGLEIITVQGEEYYVSYASLSSLDYSLGVVAPVAELDVPFLTARDQVQSNTQDSNRLFFIILVVILLAAAGASLLFSQLLSGPIVRLTNVAERVASGDWSAQARIESTDETGKLAGVFNRMTSQLREFISTLESRVAERTRNLELAAEVGRTVSQVRSLDVMLKDAAELIRKQFDLYYVQVYLTDPSQTNLILQSGTGTVGAELLGRGHQLPLNTNSINGRAAVEKKSVVVADTAHSASFKPNPLLPNTRSEMAVPLLVDKKVVGVLDMQSEHAGSLNHEIVTAFEALAGQLAIAIQNATLLAEVQQAHVEVEKQARRLSRANWEDYLDAIHKPEQTGYIFEHNKVTPLTGEEDIKDNALTAPIAVIGEVVGNLVVEMEGQAPLERTSELVNAVARQVAQQIESLRLLDSAERYRAEAEAAARRLTQAGWETYLQQRPETRRYLYDANQVRRLPAGDQAQYPVGFSQMLKVQGEAIGEIIVGDTHDMTEEATDLIVTVAERLSAHVESLRLSQATEAALAEVEQRAVELEALNRIVVNASASLNLQDVWPTIVREIAYLFKARDVVISQYQRDQRCLHVLADYDSKIDGSAITGTIIPVTDDDPVISVVETTKRSIVIPDAKNNPKTMAVRHIMIAKNIECLLVTPLLMRGEMIGTIAVDISDPERVFTPAEVKLAETIAAQLGGFLENTRLFQETQKRAERESMINTINQRIQSATTIEGALETTAREIGHLLKVRRTVVEIRTTPQNGQ